MPQEVSKKSSEVEENKKEEAIIPNYKRQALVPKAFVEEKKVRKARIMITVL